MTFLERALLTVTKGVPVIRLRPNAKAAMDAGWPQLATTDIDIIKQWNDESPNSNCGAVATPKGVWFWETDSPDVAQRVFKDTGNNINEIETFKVRSRIGRGHFYFKQNDASLAMGNVAQTYVLGQDWSARVHGAYVVGSGSVHPDTGLPYEAINNSYIAEAPQWLIDWLASQKIQKTTTSNSTEAIRNDGGKVPHGAIHGYLLREAGRLRQMGLDRDQIEPLLITLAYKHCAPPLDEHKIKTMALSICNFPEGHPTVGLQMGGVVSPLLEEDDDEDQPVQKIPYPVFPSWVMAETSLYDNLVKPFCDVNSRIDYFMWVPAMIMLLNYVSPKLKIKGLSGDRDFKGNFYNILIGDADKAMKSSSIKDAQEYFNYIGCLVSAGRDLKAAEGRIITTTVGSMESLGLTMQRVNAKSAILIYDELKTLVSKAGIEGSSMSGQLLTCYEGAAFTNGVKASKDSFSIEPPHCISLLACNPVKNFTELWSRLAGETTGMDSRFTLTLQPEVLPEERLLQGVNFLTNAPKTRMLIDKAINQGTFDYEDAQNDPRLQAMVKESNRKVARVEKWALGFAVDLGYSEIDAECIHRAIDIVNYEDDVRKFMEVYEAKTMESQIQQEILRTLSRSEGRMGRRALQKALGMLKYGLRPWNESYKLLVNNGLIHEQGTGRKNDPLIVVLGRRKADENTQG
jgi:Bifunctional DNA primase/polymerase, N-terminal